MRPFPGTWARSMLLPFSMNATSCQVDFPTDPLVDCLEQLRSLEAFLSDKLEIYRRSGRCAPSLVVNACKELQQILARGLEGHDGVGSFPRGRDRTPSRPVRGVLRRASLHPPVGVAFELCMELDSYLLDAAREEMARLLIHVGAG